MNGSMPAARLEGGDGNDGVGDPDRGAAPCHSQAGDPRPGDGRHQNGEKDQQHNAGPCRSWKNLRCATKIIIRSQGWTNPSEHADNPALMARRKLRAPGWAAGTKKGAWKTHAPHFQRLRRKAWPYSSSERFPFRAAPRMSPSEAPESEEPYWATASFSSEISRALMESEILRLALS